MLTPCAANPAQRRPWLPLSLWTTALVVFTAQLAFDMTPPLLRYPRLALTALMYVLLCIKIFLMDGRSLKELALISLFLLAAGLGALATGNRWYLRTFLLIFAARGIPVRKLAISYTVFMAAVLLINLLRTALGLTEDILTIRPGTDYYRHSFGFIHPNALSAWVFLVSCGVVLITPRKQAYYVYPLLIIAALVTFRFTDCRGGLGASGILMVLCVVIALFGRRLEKTDLLCGLLIAMTVLLPLAMVILSLLYTPDSRIFTLLDKVLSCRLSYARLSFDQLPLTLFGNPESISLFHPEGYEITLDCMYVNSLLQLGIIPSALMLWLLIRSVLRMWEARELMLLAVFTALMIFSLLEPLALQCQFFPIFAVSASLGNENKKWRPL